MLPLPLGFECLVILGSSAGNKTRPSGVVCFVHTFGVLFEWGSAVLRGSTRDISSNGMFIEVPDTLWVGAGFTARLHLPQPVKLDCMVKRVEPGRGMGVSVALAEAESQKLYHDLLSSLTPPGI